MLWCVRVPPARSRRVWTWSPSRPSESEPTFDRNADEAWSDHSFPGCRCVTCPKCTWHVHARPSLATHPERCLADRQFSEAVKKHAVIKLCVNKFNMMVFYWFQSITSESRMFKSPPAMTFSPSAHSSMCFRRVFICWMRSAQYSFVLSRWVVNSVTSTPCSWI